MEDVPHGGGVLKRMDATLKNKINRFCMLHYPGSRHTKRPRKRDMLRVAHSEHGQ